MDKKPKMCRQIGLIVSVVLVLICLTGCSTWNSLANWIPFLDSGGSRYGMLGHKDVAQFVSAVRPCKGNPDAHYRLAAWFQKRKRHAAAIEEFKTVLAIDPAYAKAYNGMGVSYDEMGDFDRAVRAYQRALELNPDLDYAYNNLGYSYLMQEKYDAAVEVFRKAVALNDGNRRYHNNLGMAHALNGRSDLAFEHFKQGGDMKSARHNMAQFHKHKEFYAEAGDHDSSAPTMLPVPPDDVADLNPAESGSMYPDHEVDRNSIASSTAFSADSKQLVSEEDNAVEVGVSNGNGIRHMARSVGGYLGRKGFNVTEVSNADHFNYAKTIIYYQKDYLHGAYEVAKQIPGYQNMTKVSRFEQPNIKVRVLIGKDLAGYRDEFVEKQKAHSTASLVSSLNR